jgi:hypothetical protein
MTVSSLAAVTSTLPPGFRPIFFRRAAGITTCPLAEVDTMGILYTSVLRRSTNTPRV